MRDRNAEVIRTVLHTAGRREFSERHDGFVVEGGDDGAPFLVACTDEAKRSAPQLTRYQVDLVKAGYRGEPDPKTIRCCWCGTARDPVVYRVVGESAGTATLDGSASAAMRAEVSSPSRT
ncbi:hypothetical protein GCM10010412_098810 [Nonomuraea recticatena]|uniref:Uncharacterized protein n=1 Tax=Nonomuraea recticatena TaxID=46178 RepID=A0ABN3TE15_9ACTN